MSAALVRKSLALVDADSHGSRADNNNVIKQLMPENQKLKRQLANKGRNGQKINLLQVNKKITILEAKKTQKSRKEILKSNLEKLNLIRAACKIDLEKDITEKLIERAVTKKSIKKKKKAKVVQKTAFTEEDFKKFEAEYFDKN